MFKLLWPVLLHDRIFTIWYSDYIIAWPPISLIKRVKYISSIWRQFGLYLWRHNRINKDFRLTFDLDLLTLTFDLWPLTLTFWLWPWPCEKFFFLNFFFLNFFPKFFSKKKLTLTFGINFFYNFFYNFFCNFL